MDLRQDRAFRAAICEQPADDSVRLIYSDWLDEFGGPYQRARAEFIRLQILREQTAELPLQTEYRLRERAVLAEHERTWRKELPTLSGVEWHRFWRGFVSGADVHLWRHFRRCGERIFAATPIEFLRIHSMNNETCERFFGSPLLSRVRGLSLMRTNLTDKGFETIGWSSHLTSLRELSIGAGFTGQPVGGPPISHSFLGWSGMRALITSEVIGRLDTLVLRDVRLGEGVESQLWQHFGDRLQLVRCR